MELSKRHLRVAVVVVLLLGGIALGYAVFADSTDPYTVTEGTTYDAFDGPQIALGETIDDLTVEQPFADENTIDFAPYGEFSSPSDGSEATVTGFGEDYIRLEEVYVVGNELQLDIPGKNDVDISGHVITFEYRDIDIEDDGRDFSIETVSLESGTVTIHGLPADQQLAAYDLSDGEPWDWGVTNSEGELTLSGEVSTEADFTLLEPPEPIIDDGSADPTGGQSDVPDNLSVDVSHPEMDYVDVEVDFWLNDEFIGSDTLTENGTATVSGASDDVVGGENNWYVIASDDYENEVQGDTYQFETPDEIRIYDETNPSQLIDDQVEVGVEFYFDESGQVVERNTTDGIIDMVGLPVDEPVTIVADADEYHPRRIFLRSVVEEAEVFLLPTDAESVSLVFTIEDYTGQFPDRHTVMQIQRNLDGEWKTVEGDSFGASGEFSSELEYNTRHRLILINTETGEERDLGTITPTADSIQSIEVTPEATDIGDQLLPTFDVSPSVSSLPAVDGAAIGVSINPQGHTVDEWSVLVERVGNDTTETLLDESFVGIEDRSVSESFNLSGHEGDTVRLTLEVATDEGRQVEKVYEFSVREHYDHDYSLLSVLGNMAYSISSSGAEGGTTTFIAIMLTVLASGAAASALQASTEVVGGVAMASISMFAIVGWVPYGLIFAGCVTFLAFFALRRGI